LAAILVALLLLVERPNPMPTAGAQFVFLPTETNGEWDAVGCDFRNPHNRMTMGELWGSPLQPCSLGRGWTYPSASGILGMGRHPRFEIWLPTGGAASLLMRIKAYQNPEREGPQTVTVRVNGSQFGPTEVADDWTVVQFPVPDGVFRSGINQIVTTFTDRASPADSGRRDTRKFSAYVREVAVVRGDDGTLPPDEADRALRRASRRVNQPAARFDSETQEIVVSQSGTLVLPMSFGADADRCEVRVVTKGGRRTPPRLQIRVRSLSSAAVVGPTGPTATDNEPTALLLAADAAAVAGETGLVMVDVGLAGKRQLVRVSQPVVATGGSEVTSDDHAAGPDSASPTLPDIVMITLDAARPDHFSCYGYQRETTPNIDRLASGSLVFTEAFALAPYTLCSVPTMVTGLSPLDHQITNHGHRLSNEATTLAEYLSAVGYRTACISATPNNSRTIGTDQGYDDFIETWRIEPRPGSRDPFLLSKMAIDWLAKNEDAAPIHLQLHYVPPHAPYDPRPEHDLFTDPEYAGQADGYHTTLGALDHEIWHRRPGDLEHVVALYDGNLREADAAVGQVLEALRQRSRWRDTVVLVTADHGEAFLEHGRMGHNSTLYDEMLRVPFILRVPEGTAAAENVNLSRLASLADIVPTLLARADVRSDIGLAGIDLLHASRHPGRFLVARTTGDPPLYGLRTSQWKLVLSGSGQGALFNVARDPDERDDLALRVRPPFAGLGMLLAERIARPPRFQALPELEELPEEDTEMLKALGYLQ
jgi:arylsulfatase